MGITGSDLVEEAGAQVEVRLPLGVGRCRLAMCVPIDSDVQSPRQLDGKRNRDQFSQYHHHLSRQASGDRSLGSIERFVEVMISLGVADAIVDLVETGSTLAANRLRILTELDNMKRFSSRIESAAI